MTDTLQQSISKMRLGTASTALTLAVVLGLGLAATQPAQAQTFTVLHTFAGYPSDGATPYAGLVRDPAGDLYGTTYNGGAHGLGTVFEVNTAGTETVLYSFCSQSNCTDGDNPYAGLIRDSAGNLYGTTVSGGSYSAGIVFRVSKTGKETVLHTFFGGTTDGCNPYGGLLMDSSGNLYGAARYCGGYSAGVIYKVTNSGGSYTESVIYSFAGGRDGAYPQSNLVMDGKGRLYGTTYNGGGGGCTLGCGMVFRLTESSGNWTKKVLHIFENNNVDGNSPNGVTLDSKANIYGTTAYGGAFGVGIVFALYPPKTKQGGYKEIILHAFYGEDDGEYPFAGVVLDAAGNLYGDTNTGGTYSYGTVFKVDANGKETLLHSFGFTDGSRPYSGVILDKKGNLYGATPQGGKDTYGVVWKLTP